MRPIASGCARTRTSSANFEFAQSRKFIRKETREWLRMVEP